MFVFVLLLLLEHAAASLEIACGWYHNCVFVRGQQAMKCWGANRYNQLGYNSTNNTYNQGDEENEMGANLPLVHIGTNFVVEAMRLGWLHTCALSGDRAMKCFGLNAYAQLGFDHIDPVNTTGDALPFLEFGAGINVSKIAAGREHSCALSTDATGDATLKCFGSNDYGQCGAGTATDPLLGPPSQINAVDFGATFVPVDVHTFLWHVCAVSQQGTLKCFGRGFAQPFAPETMGDAWPTVDLGTSFVVAAFATGGYHTCALSTTKKVKCWGSNNYGQSGMPSCGSICAIDLTGDDLPVLDLGADFVPMQLALGDWHTCILSESNTLKCFGYNHYGQLGIGNSTDVGTPSTLTGIDLGTDFAPRQVCAGHTHTCAVSNNDGVKCWGSNNAGQLGLGHTEQVGDEPDEMGDDLPFVHVCLGTLGCTTDPTTATPTTAAPTTFAPSSAPSSDVPTTTTNDSDNIVTESNSLSWPDWVVIVSCSFLACVCCVSAAVFYVNRRRNKQMMRGISAVIAPPPPPHVPVFVSAPAANDADNEERKQGEEDIELPELEMASADQENKEEEKEEVKEQPFEYDENMNYKKEGARVSLVTPGIAQENNDGRNHVIVNGPQNTTTSGSTVGNIDPSLGTMSFFNVILTSK